MSGRQQRHLAWTLMVAWLASILVAEIAISWWAGLVVWAAFWPLVAVVAVATIALGLARDRRRMARQLDELVRAGLIRSIDPNRRPWRRS